MKAFQQQWHYPGLPSDPRLDFVMDNARYRKATDWFLDQMLTASCELDRMRDHYERELQELRSRVKDLEARFLQDSHNSNLPPSSDGLRKPVVSPSNQMTLLRTRSLRKKSGKKPGAQPGHKPHVLEPEKNPDRVVTSPVHFCARCRRPLNPAALIQYETRQVIDLFQGKRWVVEYRAEMKLCPQCGYMNHGGFSPEAQAYVCYGPEVKRVALYFIVYQLVPPLRVIEIFADLFQLRISEGSLHRFSIELSRDLKEWENETKRELIRSKVVHFDESGIRCQGKGQWLHVASSRTHTLYFHHPSRGQRAMDEMGILPDLQGTAVHDGWSVYWRFRHEGVSHALCNQHHLRELTFVYEFEGENSRWAQQMKQLLQSTLHQLHLTQRRGKRPSLRWIRKVESQYDRILRKGYRCYNLSMPGAPGAPRAGPKSKKDTGHNLLLRLHYYRMETLRFLHDPLVPFGNEQAEQDIRMIKVKQKISGCFRSFGGAKAFCRIRSFISTARKQGKNAFMALAQVLQPVDYSALEST